MTDEDGLQFVDTNILVYAHDRTAGAKQARARELIESLWEKHLACISVQVMQEFYVVATKKVAKPLESATAVHILQDLSYWRVHEPVTEDVLGAIGLQQRHELSFWDAMILWSAQQLDCDVVWSEDLSANKEYDGIRVVNPFEE